MSISTSLYLPHAAFGTVLMMLHMWQVADSNWTRVNGSCQHHCRHHKVGIPPMPSSLTCTMSCAACRLLQTAASFGTGLTYGGPAVCIWGWLGVSFCMLCIALGMAELCSAYPTSGGMYYWQYKLAGRRVGPFACWLTGMLFLSLNLLVTAWQERRRMSIGSSTSVRHIVDMLCCAWGSCGQSTYP
jgi:hypothetical protein